MPASAYDELAEELREQIRERALDAAPPAEVWTVVKVSPLVIEREDEDDRLEEGDDDFEVSAAVNDAELSAGDSVIVIRDADGDYLAAAPLGGGGALGRHAAKHKGVHGMPDVPTNGRGVIWNDATQQWDVAPDFELASSAAARQARQDALYAAPQQMYQWSGAHGSGVAASSLGVYGGGLFGTAALTTNTSRPPSWWHYIAADHAKTGYVAQFVLRLMTGRNAVAPGGQWIFGPWQVTSLGAAGAAAGITYAMAAAFKGGPRVTLNPYTFSGGHFHEATVQNSGWMTAVDAGWVDGDVLAMGVNTNTLTATNSYTTYDIRLFRRWIPA